MSRKWFSIIVPLLVGVMALIGLFIVQEPIYAIDGAIRYRSAIDPHIVIIYTALSVTMSLAVVDFVYWLIGWCKKQDTISWCRK